MSRLGPSARALAAVALLAQACLDSTVVPSAADPRATEPAPSSPIQLGTPAPPPTSAIPPIDEPTPNEPSGPEVLSIATGTGFACALVVDGEVACWGYNRAANLGLGTLYNSVIPQVVDLPGPATQVTAGESHACALLQDTTLRCWGDDGYGAVGGQTYPDLVLTPSAPAGVVVSPLPVPGMDNVVAVSAGRWHTCAVRKDGTAWCWGSNYNRELGVRGIKEDSPPTSVAGISTAVAVAAGDSQSCFLLEDATVTCVGSVPGTYPGDPFRGSYEPTPIDGFAGVTALSAGREHMCGVIADGTVRCLGSNWNGQLGDGTLEQRNSAVPVVGIENAVALGASETHTCVATSDGDVLCWGADDDGELGQRVGPGGPYEPRRVGGVQGVTAIDVGLGFTCAVARGVGTCWGRNDTGQLGDRTIFQRREPRPISWVPDTADPTAGRPSFQIRRGDRPESRRRAGEYRAFIPVLIAVPVDDGVDGTGVDHVEIRFSRNGGSTWGAIQWRPQTWRRSFEATGTVTVQVRPVDRVGNVGKWVTSPVFEARQVDETSAAIRYKGKWHTEKTGFVGASTLYTTAGGASATFTFTGHSVGLVSAIAPKRGAFRVFVDGVDTGLVNLDGQDEWDRVIVFAQSWPTRAEHTVRIVALVSSDRPRVDLDAFVVIR